ncbi:MAG: N-acetyltransferase [Rhodospirillaceae bacterium]|nr:N-acetyltransferase [Rhodospirillaceae bacterium]MBT6509459.1 N-acetyltransferase [Rhodospirillaceae bacterium]MBT7611751.1 N-acetyltransferase [Rhodospirillaceae bacterium]
MNNVTDSSSQEAGPDEAGITLQARSIASIHDVARDDWDACAGPDNPFLLHTFMACLEDSGSAVPETGWAPAHILLEDMEGALLGCAPAYFKSHSYGEFVFDHGWADAFERAGGRYYPKLLIAVPFTPATGPRLLVPVCDEADAIRKTLAATIVRVAEEAGVSSAHVNFSTAEEWELMGKLGFLQRTGVQFHWENDAYEDFDGFLTSLNSRKRKAIRKERREAVENDIEIVQLTGAELTSDVWDAFYAFYRDTGTRKWGTPYLTREFFDLLGERMGDEVLLVMCRREGRWIAGALNLIGKKTLFGRYWGCVEDHRMLHFEVCYYQAIDYAIAHGLERVEAGAQGSHKIQRGYMPMHTYSTHWIEHGGLRDAVANYLKEEGQHIDWEVEAIEENYSPFRKTDQDL